MKVITEYPIIDNGKVLANKSRCGEKCSSSVPFLYQDGEYSNVGGVAPSKGGSATVRGVNRTNLHNRRPIVRPVGLKQPVIVETKKGSLSTLNIAIGVAAGIGAIVGIMYLVKHFKK